MFASQIAVPRNLQYRAALAPVKPRETNAIAGAIDVASMVHGTVAYGGMSDSETIFLQFATGEARGGLGTELALPRAGFKKPPGPEAAPSVPTSLITVRTKPNLLGDTHRWNSCWRSCESGSKGSCDLSLAGRPIDPGRLSTACHEAATISLCGLPPGMWDG